MKFVRTFALLLLALVVGGHALGNEPSAAGGSAPAAQEALAVRTATFSGVLFETPVYRTVQGVRFEVPAGYLHPWPERHDVHNNPIPDWNDRAVSTLSINFWMPSLRFVEVSRFSNPSFRPQERGRSLPDAETHAVFAGLEVPFVELSPKHITVRKRIENFVRSRGESFPEPATVDPNGLMRLTDRPHRLRMIHYFSQSADDLDVLIRCAAPDSVASNKGCHGYVYFPDERAEIYLRFVADRMSEWREIARSALTLFKRFRVSSPNSE